ncbi:reverse transcriptase domain-containing protein [Dissulfuribacter thermophilus]|nr:reverse transcriptase domain-containing protein [Dissulfuribacter thermophilus]
MTNSSTSKKQPSRGDDGCYVMKPALGATLFELLGSINLKDAWKRVKANKGAPGIDGITIQEYPQWINQHWPRIQQELIDGSYKPPPVRRVMIPKPDGGKRPLGIPTVMDRVIQQGLLQIMTPVFESSFSESSYGFRPNRSAHDAVRQMKEYVKQGYNVVVDMDISNFFENVDHDASCGQEAKGQGHTEADWPVS